MDQQNIRKLILEGGARFPGQKKAGGSRNKRNNPEEQLQRSCHDWNERHIYQFKFLQWMFHSPNGGGRSKAESGVLKAMGVKTGIPDFMLPFASGDYPGLGIELKSLTGVLSDDQRAWLRHALFKGWCVAVIRNIDHYIKVIKEFERGIMHNPLYGNSEILHIPKPRLSKGVD